MCTSSRSNICVLVNGIASTTTQIQAYVGQSAAVTFVGVFGHFIIANELSISVLELANRDHGLIA